VGVANKKVSQEKPPIVGIMKLVGMIFTQDEVRAMATVEEKIRAYVASSSDDAFITSEFVRFRDRSTVARALRKLVEDETLYRLGYEGSYSERIL